MSTDVKTELLLAAQDDLKKFAQEVKQVKSLEHVVSGTELEGKNNLLLSSFTYTLLVVDKLKPQLSSMDVIHVNQTKQLNQLTKEISDLMERYNKTVSTTAKLYSLSFI